MPTSSTAPPPPLVARPSATDGGTIEVTEVGSSVLEEHDNGSATMAWAATFKNTSHADLLAYVNFELTWHGADGETDVIWSSETNEVSLQQANDVLPGRTAVIGGRFVVDFVPASLDVSVDQSEWYQMAALQAHDRPVGVEVTGYHIDIGPKVRIEVDFTSSYEDELGEEDLRLLVVLRDAAGILIGAATAGGGFAASPPGAREQIGTVRLSQWPDATDVDNSEVVIAKVV
jgi:hypothetical protein